MNRAIAARPRRSPPWRTDMDILFILIPLSTLLIALAVAAFVWAVRDGQFEARDDERSPPP